MVELLALTPFDGHAGGIRDDVLLRNRHLSLHDVRTVLAFKVSEPTLQKLVPDGWEISPPPAGPTKGFNIAVVLIDSISTSDADGKPVVPFRGSVLAIPARKKGTDTTVSLIKGWGPKLVA